jgi:hypothetical protein
MASSLTLTPRYGRDYKSKAEALKAWTDGADFTVADMFNRWHGAATSIRDSADLKAEGTTSVHIRYRKLTMICVVKL